MRALRLSVVLLAPVAGPAAAADEINDDRALSALVVAEAPGTQVDPRRPWLRASGPEGEMHFAQFQANCMETNARLVRIEERAKSGNWKTVEKDKDAKLPDGAAAKAWRYEVSDREYVVVATEWSWTYSNKPDLKGLPIRQCSVMTGHNADGGALSALMKTFDSPGCGTTDLGSYGGVQWRKRGPGFLVNYDFIMDQRNKDKPTDGIAVMRVGADKTFAEIDASAVC